MNDDSMRPDLPKDDFVPERDGPLLSAWLDNELDDEQAAAIEKLLERSEEARDELAGLRRVQEVAVSLRLKDASPEAWERFHASLYNRAERSLGWLLLAVGVVIVGGWGIFEFVKEFFFAGNEPWYLRLGVGSLCIGLLVLFISVIRERVYRRSRSRYKDVVR